MKKLIHTLLILSFLPIAAIGQTINVSGNVTQNGELVPDTLVAIMYPNVYDTIAYTMTDENGFYEMDVQNDNPTSDSMLVWISTDACPGNLNAYSILPSSTTINLDCDGSTQNTFLYIGGTPTSEDQLSWYFINNFNTGVASYSWLIEGETYTTPWVSHTFSQQGNYYINLTVEMLNGDIDSAQFNVEAGTTATGGSGNCQAIFFPLTDSIEDGSIYFVNSSLGDNLTFFWDFGDGSSSTEPYPTHIFADDEAIYTVCLTISGDDCDQQYCTEVSGGLDGSGLITNNTKHGETGLSKSGTFEFVVIPVQSGSTGIDDVNSPVPMGVYPNPSTGMITLQLNLPSTESGRLNITDITGKTVMQKTIRGNGSDNLITLNLESLADGTYLVQYQGSRISKVQKVILQR